MIKVIYIVRHCQATGQEEDAELTNKGRQQAGELVSFFSHKSIDQIISSPFVRAQESIKWVAKKRSITVQLDDRLGERVLSTENLPDWMEKLKATFTDPNLTFSGANLVDKRQHEFIRWSTILMTIHERSSSHMEI